MKKCWKLIIMIFILSIIFSCLSGPDVDSKFKQANKYRDIIKKYKLQNYDAEGFQNAEKNYADAQKFVESKNKSEADKALTEANSGYLSVIEKGFPLCLDDRNKEVQESRKNSTDIKADIAVKEEFEDAESTLNGALKFKDQKNYESAIDSMELAKSKFEQVYKDASFKKDRTEKSIESTETVKKDIEAKAAEFEKQLHESNEEKKGE